MGQYHIWVNLNKREYIDPHKLGSGLKAWEQMANPGIGRALVVLMTCPEPRGGGDLEEHEYVGRWHGDHVVMVGDYAEADDFQTPNGVPKPNELYDTEATGFTDVTDGVCAVIEDEMAGRFVGDDGWRRFLTKEDVVTKHRGGEQMTGIVTSVEPITIQWSDGKKQTIKDASKKIDFF